MTTVARPRGHGDIQAAVVKLVDHLVPVVGVARQPGVAYRIARIIADRPSSISSSLLLRQSIIRRGTATAGQVTECLAAWVTVLFDLGNLRHDRGRALRVAAAMPEGDLACLRRCLAGSANGCILAVPHIGSIELFCAYLAERGFPIGFVHTISDDPTPTEQWIHAGRRATGGRPIRFGQRSTGQEIAEILRNNGIVLMVADVYPSARYAGIPVRMHDVTFNLPPGPARYARFGTPVLPGFASRRDARGFSMRIGAPLGAGTSLTGAEAGAVLSQRLADRMGEFTAMRADDFWLWHPIPNDPFIKAVQRQRPDLAHLLGAAEPDDEATALAVEAIDPWRLADDAGRDPCGPVP